MFVQFLSRAMPHVKCTLHIYMETHFLFGNKKLLHKSHFLTNQQDF